jgi:hypothetical protein
LELVVILVATSSFLGGKYFAEAFGFGEVERVPYDLRTNIAVQS